MVAHILQGITPLLFEFSLSNTWGVSGMGYYRQGAGSQRIPGKEHQKNEEKFSFFGLHKEPYDVEPGNGSRGI